MILNYRELYKVVKIAVVEDPGYIDVARFLFFPIENAFNDLGGIGLFEVTPQNSRQWSIGGEEIPGEAKRITGKKESLKLLVDYYSKMSDRFFVDVSREDMFDALAELVDFCDIPLKKKNKWLKLHDDGDDIRFLAGVFQFAVQQKNRVASGKKQKKASDPNSEAADEFKSLVGKKLKKPRAIVPETVQPEELGYVKELYAAYKDATGVSVENPDDLDRLNYRQHFEQQRKTYYSPSST